MQALTVVAAGTSKRLELTDVPEPKPQSQEVAITVTSAGIGLIDAFWGTGVMPQLDNFIPGLEVAGVISAVITPRLRAWVRCTAASWTGLGPMRVRAPVGRWWAAWGRISPTFRCPPRVHLGAWCWW